MRKKVLSVVLAAIFLLQTMQFGMVFASNDELVLDIATIAQKGTVHRGSMEYGQFDSQNVIIIKPGYSTKQTGTTVVFDYKIPEPIVASEYRYIAFEYYKDDTTTAIKFKPSLDGKMTTLTCDATSNKWFRAIYEILPANSESKMFGQFHFLPFGDQDANSVSDKRCYIKSIKLYKQDPTTQEEVAAYAQIKEDLLKQNEAIRGADEELAIFEDLDKLDKTAELVKDPGFENESNVWKGSEASVSIVSSGAYEGAKCAKVSGRSGKYSGISQDVKDALNANGPGDYRISAFIKNDAGSKSTSKDYKLAIFLNGKEVGNSTFHIKDTWQKINGALRLNWTGELSSASIKVSSVNGDDLADFYVDNVSMVKCLYNEEETTHAAYMKGDVGGKFLPEGNITRAETVAIVSRLMADEAKFKGTCVSNYPDVVNTEWYYDNVAYLESLGLLTYFQGNFNPNTPITRAEFVYLVKNISVLEEGAEKTFTDIDASHPLYNDMIKASKTGLIAGYEDNTFRPDANITRAEAVTLVNRATKRFPTTASYYGAKTTVFTDVDESHWACDQIIEAATTHDTTIFDKGDKFVEAWKITADNYDKELAKKVEDEANAKAEALKNEILNAKDELTITGTKYYVSNNGNDDNTGLSPEQAWKTVDKANAFEYKKGDAVLFERGGLWRGATILCQSGVTYGAYGEGEKPKLYASARNYADPEYWKETDTPNVWTTTEKLSNIGFLQFDGEIMSQKVYSKAQLNKNFNFMQEKYNSVPVLLYYDGGNPGKAFKNIEIAPEYSIFIADHKSDITIDNICMRYTGWHGVKFANVNNIKITNCEVGWIGGTGGSPTSSQTRWGNGIEFWQNCNNTLVDHCYVYQVYDAGVTNQWKGPSEGVVVEENVTYTNNLIEYCTYSYEFFMNQENSNSAIMKDVTFRNNISRYCGQGWGQDNRPNKDTAADIKGWSSINKTENFVVENNTFIGAKLLNVHFGSYTRNLAAATRSFNNKMPQYLIKLDGNTYINNTGRKFTDYNYFTYETGYGSNYDFVKDNIDLNAKLILTDTKYGSDDKKEEESTTPSTPVVQPTGENIVKNSECDNLDIWRKNVGAKGTLKVETEGDNKYISLSKRVGAYEGIEQTGIAAKLNEYGVGTYQLTGKVKYDGATTPEIADIHVIAGSYKDKYSKYNLYAKVEEVTSEWKEFSITFDSSTLEFTTWPEDTIIAVRGNSKTFNAATKLCIDDIKLVPINTKPVSGTTAPADKPAASTTPTSSGKAGEASKVASEEAAKNILKNGNMDKESDWTLAASTPKAVKLTYEKESNGNKYIKMAGRTADWIGIEQKEFASKLTTGKTYVFKALVKIENDVNAAGGIDVYIVSTSNKEFKIDKKFTNIGDAWKNIEFEFTLDTVPSDIKINLRGATSKAGGNIADYGICFDDITIFEK